MKPRRANAALIALIIAAGAVRLDAQGSSRDSVRLTLTESIARAGRVTTPVLLGEDSLRVSDARVREAQGRFLPAAGMGLNALEAQGTGLLSSTALVASEAGWRSASYQVSTALNVFNGFRDRSALQTAKFSRDASSYSLESARQSASFDVLQRYFQIVLDRRLSDVARANLALSQSRQAQLEEAVRVGTRAPPDLYRQQAQTAADQSSVIDVEARTQSDVVELLQRLRIEPTRPYTVVEPELDTLSLPADSLSFDLIVQQALRARPDLHAAQSRSAAADAAVAEATGLYLPRVILGADYIVAGRVYDWERQNGANLLTTDQRSLTTQLGGQGVGIFSLGVSWSLFDRFETPLEVERARAAARLGRLAAEDARLRVLGDARRAIDDYGAATQKLVASESGLSSAQEAFDAVSGRFDAGLATFIDVLAAQTALTQARALHQQATVNVALRRDVLRYVAGQPLVER